MSKQKTVQAKRAAQWHAVAGYLIILDRPA
jgi:hypothetical protein